MTNTEAFKEAMKIIEENIQHNWKANDPIKAFLTPQRVIWLWLRIRDYYVINEKLPKSYRSLHAWEKKYYENNM